MKWSSLRIHLHCYHHLVIVFLVCLVEYCVCMGLYVSVCLFVCLSVSRVQSSNFDTAIIIYGGFSCKVKVGVSQLNYYQYKEMCYTHKQTDNFWHVVMWDKL